MKSVLIKDKVYNLLLKSILSLEYVPGQQLPKEVDLSSQLKVSRQTLRCALDKLENGGMIERVKGKGTFIAKKIHKEKIVFILPVAFGLTDQSSFHEIFQGVLEEAANLNCDVETIAMSKTNSEDDIDWSKLFNLDCSSKVILCTFWFRNIFSYIVKKRCMASLIYDNEVEKIYNKYDISSFCKIIRHMDHSAKAVAEEMLQRGAKKILFVMPNSAKAAHNQYDTMVETCEKFDKSVSVEKVVFMGEKYDELLQILSEKSFDGIILKAAFFPYEEILERYSDKLIGLLDINKHKINLNRKNFFYSSYDTYEIGREAVRQLMNKNEIAKTDFYVKITSGIDKHNELISQHN